MHLSRGTITTIRELVLNGSNTEHDDVFRCRDLDGVRSAIIVTPILARQQSAFAVWAGRLEKLSECSVNDGDEPISSMQNIPAGCLQRMRRLRLEVAIPGGMDRMLGIAGNLERIQFMPAPVLDDAGYTHYLEQLNDLMALLHDRELLPALKIVHVTPSFVSESGQKLRHLAMRKNLWAAALSHGGWRVQSDIPTFKFDMPFPAAWRWWWATRALGFTMSLKEARQFVSMCEERGVYPRIKDYVKGPIHIQTGGVGRTKLGTLPGTAIHGVWIHHGPTTNVTASLRLVTGDTKILSICLNSYSGSVGFLIPDSRPFMSVEAFMLDGPMPDHNLATFRYTNNLCASFMKGIQLANWNHLVNISLPALALQDQPVNGVSFVSSCRRHIGGYNMDVLEGLTSLKALSISQWLSCTKCKLDPAVSFESGLKTIPQNVEYVAISGQLGYFSAVITPRMGKYGGRLTRILRTNRSDVMVICDELYLVSFSTYPHAPDRKMILTMIVTDAERATIRALAGLAAQQPADLVAQQQADLVAQQEVEDAEAADDSDVEE